jgi:copper chaperone CopZ
MKNLIKATFLIHGMNCKSCAADIMKALKKASGVTHTELLYKDGKINIVFDRTIITFKDLNKLLEPMGYYLGHSRENTAEIKKALEYRSA